jgi:hypothetical protein
MRTLCNCQEAHLFRIQRRWWMRLLYPSHGLYQCEKCGQSALLPRSVAHQRNRQAGAVRSARSAVAEPAGAGRDTSVAP